MHASLPAAAAAADLDPRINPRINPRTNRLINPGSPPCSPPAVTADLGTLPDLEGDALGDQLAAQHRSGADEDSHEGRQVRP